MYDVSEHDLILQTTSKWSLEVGVQFCLERKKQITCSRSGNVFAKHFITILNNSHYFNMRVFAAVMHFKDIVRN